MVRTALIAARNNADWCDAVCAANGVPASFGPEVWASPERTPRLYPDAVTLTPGATSQQVLTAIDASPGASVKDSFACLDLVSSGFSVLFTAQWVFWHGVDPAGTGGPWRAVSSLPELARWVGEHPNEPPFPATLLSDVRVTVLTAELAGGTVGAALYATEEAVGISNAFFTGGDLDPPLWASLVDECRRRYPGRLIVGYESGADLAAARAAGATTGGRLRIWVHES